MFDILQDELQTITIIAIRGLQIEERVALQAALDVLASLVLLSVIIILIPDHLSSAHQKQRSFAQRTRTSLNLPQTGLFLQLLTTHGYTILDHIIFGIGGGLPRSALPALAETLHCFLIRLPEMSRACLKTLLERVGAAT